MHEIRLLDISQITVTQNFGTYRCTKGPDIGYSIPAQLQMGFRAPEDRRSNSFSVSSIGRIRTDSAPEIGELNIIKADFTRSVIHKDIAWLDIYFRQQTVDRSERYSLP